MEDIKVQRMTEEEWQGIKAKIEKEFPIRLKLAAMLGRKINPKNYKELEAFDDTIAELFLAISLDPAAPAADALELIRTIR
jgi:hypothetical protein